ncbi:hypothetical protein [Microtetraspora fusca]|uniref:WXG100 family type VII secretion target n=1 Tax=Microtetraspora fusca TaxID=1997 RepID=A0ABW6V364_MICFU|nr:hypothetical protein [Microtetraspora fusca]
MSPNPNQDRYVTSNGIHKLRNRLADDVIPQFEKRRSQVDETVLGPWDLGMSGSAIILPTYESAVVRARGHLDDAIDTAQKWMEQLGIAAANWRDAEDASTVKYV